MSLVVNTRPADQAAELTRLLEDAGFDVLEAPTIQTVPAWSESDARSVLDRLRRADYDWVVFSSANAVTYLIQAMTAVGGAASDLARVRLLSGAGTAQVMRGFGLAPALVLDRFSAREAVRVLLEQRACGPVLAPRAAEGRPELGQELAEANVELDAPVLYRTVSVAPSTLTRVLDSLRRREVAAVTFTSPSTVCGLVEALLVLDSGALQLLRETPLVAIGRTTADFLEETGLQASMCARDTSLGSLVQAVLDITRPIAIAAGQSPRPEWIY